MTTVDKKKASKAELGVPVGGSSSRELTQGADLSKVPMWKIRLRLMRRSFGTTWGLFRENKMGMVGLALIGIFAIMAIIHPILMATVWEPRVYDPIRGYDAVMTEYTVVEGEPTDPTSEIGLQRARLRLNPTIQVGAVVSIPSQPAPPTMDGPYPHLLGTDPQGRDILSQLLYSTRAAFFLGAVAAITTVLIATTVGAVAAYFGGWIDGGLMRFADLILLMPLLPVLILLSAMFEINMVMLGVMIGILSGFGGVAIVMKSQALAIKVKAYIDAARVAGGSDWHVIFKHIVPNVLPLSFLFMMFGVTEAIAIEATLSFFGLLNVPMTWGIMINTAQTNGYLLSGTDYWWLLFPAGLAVSFLCFAFFLVGRGMDEVINPRLRAR
ncbi:MAG TPA: ABC transporter permease [Candidatus Limnocylindrales bacterium]|nr:ABC transporter permease [Candidatus Limnocylindrales bacterium]